MYYYSWLRIRARPPLPLQRLQLYIAAAATAAYSRLCIAKEAAYYY
jgi:hypothetical protein